MLNSDRVNTMMFGTEQLLLWISHAIEKLI